MTTVLTIALLGGGGGEAFRFMLAVPIGGLALRPCNESVLLNCTYN